MNEIPPIITERVDDMPLLLEQRQRRGLPALFDPHFPTHGHWQGLSLAEGSARGDTGARRGDTGGWARVKSGQEPYFSYTLQCMLDSCCPINILNSF
jgi:hypothetical protein